MNVGEPVFAAAVKIGLGMPIAHITMPGFDSWLHSQFKFPANVQPGRLQMTARVVGFLSPI